MTTILSPAEFASAFESGYRLVKELQEDINALNVYPVPDGDTGVNMTLTLESVVNELRKARNANFTEIGHIVVKASLSGARGNSGVILSQILKGFGHQLRVADGKGLDVDGFVKAVVEGRKSAYHAVIKPVEGTILTVIRRVAEHIDGRKYDSYEEALSDIVDVAWNTVLETPKMLDVLKKAGVVDAGGYGLYVFFEGFRAGVTKEKAKPHRLAQRVSETFIAEAGYGEYKFCTEAYLKSDNLELDHARRFLAEHGDSLVLGQEGELWHFHVHTNEPFKVLKEMEKYGELVHIKVDNMAAQVQRSFEREEKPFAVVAVAPSPKWAELFRSLNIDFVVSGGQTMNPSVGQLVDAVKHVPSRKVYIFPNNPNIILSANQVRELTDKEVIVIPTKNPAQTAVGLALYFGVEQELDEFFNEMLPKMDYLELTKATKQASVDGFEIEEGDWLVLLNDRLRGTCRDWACVLSLIRGFVDEGQYSVATVFVGADAREEELAELKVLLQSAGLEVDEYDTGQPFYPYWVLLERS
ncbi:DAK2 domain-containing protein [Coprothermobacteraceae bacterium]|nr:DAK2 domain-containing protein [Coprothermobacteraceae bacterium]